MVSRNRKNIKINDNIKLKKKTKVLVSTTVGSVSTVLGLIGILGCFCTYPILISIFSFFGVSTILLSNYSPWFLIVGIFFIFIGFTYFLELINKKSKKIYSKEKKKLTFIISFFLVIL